LIAGYNTLKYAEFTRKLAILPQKSIAQRAEGIGGKKKLNPI
jgi:hypothetical protein